MREFCVDSRDMKTKLACYAWEPKADAKAVLIMAHGMAEHLMRYEEMAEYLVSQGIIFAGPDHLGHGKSAPAPDDLGYFCEQDPATVVVRDLHRVKKTIQAENPGLPVYLMDERLTTVEADGILEETGKDPEERKSVIDQVAACLILEDYIGAGGTGACEIKE